MECMDDGCRDAAGTLAQLPAIARIIQDETWLEGERRGSPVESRDPVVVENVCAIVLRLGQSLRENAAASQAR
jgi:hypothetical protein